MNDNLAEWYLKGYNDELKGTSTIMDCDHYEEAAYDIGTKDAANGVNAKTISELVIEIARK